MHAATCVGMCGATARGPREASPSWPAGLPTACSRRRYALSAKYEWRINLGYAEGDIGVSLKGNNGTVMLQGPHVQRARHARRARRGNDCKQLLFPV